MTFAMAVVVAFLAGFLIAPLPRALRRRFRASGPVKDALKPPGPPGVPLKLDPSPVKTAVFGDTHIGTEHFDEGVRAPMPWIDKGAALLRASRAVMRQAIIDEAAKDAMAPSTQPRPARAMLYEQAIFLAALAVEDALKTLIVAANPKALGTTTPGELPRVLVSHDLKLLASQASFRPADNHEEEALRYGQNYVEYLGRYPMPLRAVHAPTHYQMNPTAIIEAFEKLYFRALDSLARLEHKKSAEFHSVTAAEHAARRRKEYEFRIGGVSPPWRGEAQAQNSENVVMRPFDTQTEQAAAR